MEYYLSLASLEVIKMNVRFSCPACGASYSVAVTDSGKKAACKKCGQKLVIPKPTQQTILGEVILPNENSETQHYEPSTPSTPHIAEADPTQADHSTEYLPPIRSASKSKQIIFLIFGVVTFLGIGIVILILIANRGKELKTEVASKKDSKSLTNAKSKANPQILPPSPKAKQPAFEEYPSNREVNSGPDVGDVANGFFEILLVVLSALAGFAVYFLPTIIAVIRGHDNWLSVFMMNLFLGCIFVGWAIAMIWACWNKKPEVHKHYHYQR